MLHALRTATVQYPERSSVSIFIYREVLRTSWQCNGAGLFSETFVARRRGKTSVIRGRLVVSKAIDRLQLCWGPDPRHYHEARKLAPYSLASHFQMEWGQSTRDECLASTSPA